MGDRIRVAAFGFLLFAAVIVDFKLMLMSVAFDLLFAGLAVAVLWPILKKHLAPTE